jgi:hypothetical protein
MIKFMIDAGYEILNRPRVGRQPKATDLWNFSWECGDGAKEVGRNI